MYRYYHELLPPDLPNNQFQTQSDIHDHNTRHANDLHIESTKTKLAQNNIKTQGPIIWNKLDTSIQKCVP